MKENEIKLMKDVKIPSSLEFFKEVIFLVSNLETWMEFVFKTLT